VTRVIAGVAGGRRLRVPPGNGTRPTSDRAREGLFSSLVSELGGLDGLRVLDLYAGSGAVGLEALSRGAASVLLVESDARAASVVKANIAAVALKGAAVVTDRVERVLAHPPPASPPGGPGYDLVFADPPYAVTAEAVAGVLGQLVGDGRPGSGPAGSGPAGSRPAGGGPAGGGPAGGGWLADGALVVVERATRSGPLAWPPGYVGGKSRRYGEATFWYGWFGSDAEAERAQQPPVAPALPLDAPRRAHEE
jgi:16S rRNA (guanine966-N2)-methyltransferase